MELNGCLLSKLSTYLYDLWRCKNAYAIHIVIKSDMIAFCIKNARLREGIDWWWSNQKCLHRYMFVTLLCKQCKGKKMKQCLHCYIVTAN